MKEFKKGAGGFEQLSTPEEEKVPPAEWFVGVWTPSGLFVHFSDALERMAGGAVGEALATYVHTQNSPLLGSERALKTPRPELEEEVVQADRVIREATGFSAEDIIRRRVQLGRLCRGKSREQLLADEDFPLQVQWPSPEEYPKT
jgi:hypothetical protein